MLLHQLIFVVILSVFQSLLGFDPQQFFLPNPAGPAETQAETCHSILNSLERFKLSVSLERALRMSETQTQGNRSPKDQQTGQPEHPRALPTRRNPQTPTKLPR
jgi:hypothetical protein